MGSLYQVGGDASVDILKPDWDSDWFPLQAGSNVYNYDFNPGLAAQPKLGQFWFRNVSFVTSSATDPVCVPIKRVVLSSSSYGVYFGTKLIKLASDSIQIGVPNGANYSHWSMRDNQGVADKIISYAAESRIKIFNTNIVPAYTSAWTAVTTGTDYTFAHGLGSIPVLVVVQVAENSDGSGWSVYAMDDSTWNSLAYRGCPMVQGDATNIILRGQANAIASYWNYAGVTTYQTAGYARVLAYTATPDYDSGWFAVSSDTKYIKEHGLGKEPSMLFLQLAENNDGTGWRVNSHSSAGYYGGSGIYWWDAKRIIIRTGIWAGDTKIAYFQGVAGADTQPTAGYAKLIAWK